MKSFASSPKLFFLTTLLAVVSHPALVAWCADAAGILVAADSGQGWQLRDSQGATRLQSIDCSVQLADGAILRGSDSRYRVAVQSGAGEATLRLTDSRKELDQKWTIRALDDRCFTFHVTLTNTGDEPLALAKICPLEGRLVDKHDPGKPHVLLNGFVTSPPHPTLRKPETTAVHSHETAALESPPLASGWLTGKHNFGHVDLGDLNDCPLVVAWGDCNGCLLPAGATRSSDLFFLSTHPKPLEQMERFASLAGRINNAKIWPPRIAWCTWYAGWQRKEMAKYEGGMEKGIERMIPLVSELFGSRWPQTMRICDDFLDYGDWSNRTKTLPGGFDRLAGLIDRAGLIPGVWYAPYWAEAQSNVLREHPEWFARDKQGNIWRETGWQPKSRDTTSFAVFDTTHPEVVDYFERTARAWRERGFRYVSTDFLQWSFAPQRYHDPTKTKAEVLRAGLEAIRRGLGPDIFYRPINNPLGVAMGIANDTRISGDSHGNNPTAYFRTGEVWFYNRRVWLNDPSAIVCARYGKLKPIEWNRMWMSWIALAGTVMTYGEVLDQLPEKYVHMYQRLFPPLPVAGRPLDIWENSPYLLWGMNPGEADGPYVLFGVFDVRGKGPRGLRLNLDEVAARCRGWDTPQTVAQDYLLWDFWQQKLVESQREQLELPLPAKSCRLFALRPKRGRPQLLGTSGHFSQGVVETSDFGWDAAKGQLRGKVQGNGGDPSTLFFYLPGEMQFAEATLGGAAIESRQPEPHVVAVDLPALAEPAPLVLHFSGRPVEIGRRPFVSGRAATRYDNQ